MSARPDQRVRWSKREKALLYGFEREKSTSMLIAHVFEGVTLGDMYGRTCGVECNRNGIMARINKGRTSDPSDERTFMQELDARGYDVTTLKFSIRRKAAP